MTGRVQADQIRCDFLYRFFYPRLRLMPLRAAQAVQLLNLLCIRSSILLNQVHLRDRDIEIAPIAICDLHVILLDTADCHAAGALINAQAMILVNNIIPDRKLRELLDMFPLVGSLLSPLFLLFAEEVSL